MRTLLTWTDRGVGPLDHHTRRPGDQGPVRRLLSHSPPYDRVWILTTTASLPGARGLASEIGTAASLRMVDLTDPSDHAQLFEGLGPILEAVRGARVDVLLSAGTPQAQTLWVLLVKSGLLDGRMLQVIPARFVPKPHPRAVREVHLDVEGFPAILNLKHEVRRLRAEVRASSSMVGGSLKRIEQQIGRLAPSRVPIWVRGETGTGKEGVARALHDASHRAQGPFVAVNAGAFTTSVLQSELFGHVAGAFTGAVRDHRGLFEQADGGTLFLDEVGELPPRVQVTLLRVLETGRVRRVGDEREVPVDVRLITATHRNLKEAAKNGTFRSDLYYRLRGAEIVLPPLRDRGGDVDLLIHHFLRGRLHIAPDVWPLLRDHDWPGNVRELKAEVERWTLLCDHTVHPHDLSPDIQGVVATSEPAVHTSLELAPRVHAVEQATIRQALTETDGNLSAAARLLGIDRNTLKRKLKRL